jgi:hypothetical protein
MTSDYQDLLRDVLGRFRPTFTAAEAHSHHAHVLCGHQQEADAVAFQADRRYDREVEVVCKMNLIELRAFAHALDHGTERLRSQILAAAQYRISSAVEPPQGALDPDDFV